MARAKKVIDWVELSDSFQKGVIVSVKVVVGNNTSTKTGLKITNLNKKTMTVMEVDRPNKKNIFRKFLRTDIVHIEGFELTLRKDVLPRKEESDWNSIGQGGYQRRGWRTYSNHSKGWSSNAPQYRSTTNNPVSGFPMV
jgi:hypothetical protein